MSKVAIVAARDPEDAPEPYEDVVVQAPGNGQWMVGRFIKWRASDSIGGDGQGWEGLREGEWDFMPYPPRGWTPLPEPSEQMHDDLHRVLLMATYQAESAADRDAIARVRAALEAAGE